MKRRRGIPVDWRPKTSELITVAVQLAAVALCVAAKPGSLMTIIAAIAWGASLLGLLITCFRRKWLEFFVAGSLLVAYRSVLDAALAWSCLVGGGIRACP